MMAVTLTEAKARARAALLAPSDGATLALTIYDQLLEAQPLADELRLEVAVALVALGKKEEAGEIYRALSVHLGKAGRPLPAVVAALALGPLGMPNDYLLGALAETYAAGAPTLAPFGSRPAPVDPQVTVELREEPDERAVERAYRRALDLSGHPPYQDHVHPIAFLSELEPDSLRAVLTSLKVRTVERGEAVVRQGDPGTSLFLVALGQLRVATTMASASLRELARLHENSLFGEMALVTAQPRGASVVASEAATVLELEREALERVRERIPSIEIALTRFTRERLIRNLLATSPLFAPFTKEQQGQLLRRFEGVEITAGTTVIRQDEAGQGLYVILSGELEVVAHPLGAGEPVTLAQLTTGDIFGEMSLLSDRPTSAAVRARTQAALLFLPRTYVIRLVEAVPEVKGYFAGIAERRAADNDLRLGAGTLPETEVVLDDSDAILI
jgi:cAMP-dependent protein kinase regulator